MPPFRRSEVDARKLVELANAFEPVQDGRLYIQKINGPFLYQLEGTAAEYKAGLDRAIARGWLGRDKRGGPMCPVRSVIAASIPCEETTHGQTSRRDKNLSSPPSKNIPLSPSGK